MDGQQSFLQSLIRRVRFHFIVGRTTATVQGGTGALGWRKRDLFLLDTNAKMLE
jgi:hypothetical protein